MQLHLTPHIQFILSGFLFKHFTATGATESLKFAQLTLEIIPEQRRQFLATQKTVEPPVCPHCKKSIENFLDPTEVLPVAVEISAQSAEFLKALLARFPRTAEQAIVLSAIELQLQD